MRNTQISPFLQLDRSFPSILDSLFDSRAGLGLYQPKERFHTKIEDGKWLTTLFVPELDPESLTVSHRDNTLHVSYRDNSGTMSLAFSMTGVDMSTLDAAYDDPVLRFTAEMGSPELDSGLVEVKGLPDRRQPELKSDKENEST